MITSFLQIMTKYSGLLFNRCHGEYGYRVLNYNQDQREEAKEKER